MVLGICAIPVDYVLKCVPDKMCPELGKKKRRLVAKAQRVSLVLRIGLGLLGRS